MLFSNSVLALNIVDECFNPGQCLGMVASQKDAISAVYFASVARIRGLQWFEVGISGDDNCADLECSRDNICVW